MSITNHEWNFGRRLISSCVWGLLFATAASSNCADGESPKGLVAAPGAGRVSGARLTTDELAKWIDERFREKWLQLSLTPPEVVDDSTFLRRTFLDLSGSIPSVSQARDFLESKSEYKRGELIERLLSETRRPEKYSERTAAHWATLWRRMIVPPSVQPNQNVVELEEWLKTQFAANVPYDELARRIVTATTAASAADATARTGRTPAGPVAFHQVVGGKPETSASAVSRIFLGTRIGCAECHDHPFTHWKQKDFWGMAAFFAGVKDGMVVDVVDAKLHPANSTTEYTPVFLGASETALPKGKTSREALADWMVSPENPQFASTAVNRVWLYLMGRGITDTVDDLDGCSAEERKILDDMAKLFVQSGYDLRWLIAGICKSEVYQRECAAVADEDQHGTPGLRIVKTLGPEQIFNALEQALALPVARADGGARFNGIRDQLVSRMNEAASNRPDEYQAGIPQALLLMNGQLTAQATDLDQSRTLRGVLEAPFMDIETKLDTLYLATFSRSPRSEEKKFLLDHIQKQSDGVNQRQAYSEIFWGLLNSPEFVLQR